MKRILCICLVALLCFSLAGCQEVPNQPKALPKLFPWEVEVIELEENANGIKGYLNFKIEEILQPDVLKVRVINRDEIEEWGERVYIVTDQAEEYCVGDSGSVFFDMVHRPRNSNQLIRVFAARIGLSYPVYKPIIYFYPEVPTTCSAKLTLKGDLTCTYPAHGEKGWENFTAYPDGTLIFPDGKEYYALYWEGEQLADWDFSQGFCVKGEETAAFLEWALAQQGLTPREANEFIVYWLPLMQENPYNVISFQTKTYTDGAALEITPAPDSLLRIFMAYYPSDTEIEIAPQTFEPFVREGFTVVEWGGGPA